MAGPAQFMTMELRGHEDVSRAFRALPIVFQERILPFALRAGAEIVKERARMLAPMRTGRLKGGRWGLRKVTKRYGSTHAFVGVRVVAPRRGELGIPSKAKGYYPFAQEFGWRVGPKVQGPLDLGARVLKRAKPTKAGRKGRLYWAWEIKRSEAMEALQGVRRKIPGRYFMSQALWNASGRVIAAVADEMRRRVDLLTPGALAVARSKEVA